MWRLTKKRLKFLDFQDFELIFKKLPKNVSNRFKKRRNVSKKLPLALKTFQDTFNVSFGPVEARKIEFLSTSERRIQAYLEAYPDFTGF